MIMKMFSSFKLRNRKKFVNSKEVLEYLLTPLDQSQGDVFKEVIREIEQLEIRLIASTSPNWAKLAKSRLLSSNTASRAIDDSLARWDEANRYISECIQDEKKLSFEIITKINSIYNAKNSKIRETPIYGGGIEFIRSQYLEEAKVLLINNLLGDVDMCFYEKAFHLYQWIVSLHFFDNGNGRTSRLCADYILMQNGKLPICFQSSVRSHVAQMLEDRMVNKEDKYLSFLKAIKRSYEVVLEI